MRIAAALAVTLSAAPALASNCFQVAEYGPRAVKPVHASLEHDEVGLTFIGHATFRIRTAGGVEAVTDYAGFWGDGGAPDIATMNRAHSSHWTPYPSPEITHLLRGWDPDGGEPQHYVEVGDLIVRNVATDIRGWDGEVQAFGNSIFIFEVAGLCIGHLGHLHHKPTEAHYGMIGRLDVVMAPVDGGYTMNLAAMTDVLKRLRARVVIPMHWFGPANLERFIAGMQGEFAIERPGSSRMTVSMDTLPTRPTVVVLEGR